MCFICGKQAQLKLKSYHHLRRSRSSVIDRNPKCNRHRHITNNNSKVNALTSSEISEIHSGHIQYDTPHRSADDIIISKCDQCNSLSSLQIPESNKVITMYDSPASNSNRDVCSSLPIPALCFRDKDFENDQQKDFVSTNNESTMTTSISTDKLFYYSNNSDNGIDKSSDSNIDNGEIDYDQGQQRRWHHDQHRRYYKPPPSYHHSDSNRVEGQCFHYHGETNYLLNDAVCYYCSNQRRICRKSLSFPLIISDKHYQHSDYNKYFGGAYTEDYHRSGRRMPLPQWRRIIHKPSYIDRVQTAAIAKVGISSQSDTKRLRSYSGMCYNDRLSSKCNQNLYQHHQDYDSSNLFKVNRTCSMCLKIHNGQDDNSNLEQLRNEQSRILSDDAYFADNHANVSNGHNEQDKEHNDDNDRNFLDKTTNDKRSSTDFENRKYSWQFRRISQSLSYSPPSGQFNSITHDKSTDINITPEYDRCAISALTTLPTITNATTPDDYVGSQESKSTFQITTAGDNVSCGNTGQGSSSHVHLTEKPLFCNDYCSSNMNTNVTTVNCTPTNHSVATSIHQDNQDDDHAIPGITKIPLIRRERRSSTMPDCSSSGHIKYFLSNFDDQDKNAYSSCSSQDCEEICRFLSGGNHNNIGRTCRRRVTFSFGKNLNSNYYSGKESNWHRLEKSGNSSSYLTETSDVGDDENCLSDDAFIQHTDDNNTDDDQYEYSFHQLFSLDHALPRDDVCDNSSVKPLNEDNDCLMQSQLSSPPCNNSDDNPTNSFIELNSQKLNVPPSSSLLLRSSNDENRQVWTWSKSFHVPSGEHQDEKILYNLKGNKEDNCDAIISTTTSVTDKNRKALLPAPPLQQSRLQDTIHLFTHRTSIMEDRLSKKNLKSFRNNVVYHHRTCTENQQQRRRLRRKLPSTDESSHANSVDTTVVQPSSTFESTCVNSNSNLQLVNRYNDDNHRVCRNNHSNRSRQLQRQHSCNYENYDNGTKRVLDSNILSNQLFSVHQLFDAVHCHHQRYSNSLALASSGIVPSSSETSIRVAKGDGNFTENTDITYCQQMSSSNNSGHRKIFSMKSHFSVNDLSSDFGMNKVGNSTCHNKKNQHRHQQQHDQLRTRSKSLELNVTVTGNDNNAMSKLSMSSFHRFGNALQCSEEYPTNKKSEISDHDLSCLYANSDATAGTSYLLNDHVNYRSSSNDESIISTCSETSLINVNNKRRRAFRINRRKRMRNRYKHHNVIHTIDPNPDAFIHNHQCSSSLLRRHKMLSKCNAVNMCDDGLLNEDESDDNLCGVFECHCQPNSRTLPTSTITNKQHRHHHYHHHLKLMTDASSIYRTNLALVKHSVKYNDINLEAYNSDELLQNQVDIQSTRQSAATLTDEQMIIKAFSKIPGVSADVNSDEDDPNNVPIKSPSGRFIRLEEIGRGAFKTVYKGLDSADGVAVAWCELQDVYNRTERLRFREEVKLLKELQHPNIVRFFDHWFYHHHNRRIIVLVTELMTSGSLKTYLRNFQIDLNAKKLKIIKSWCRQILLGLAYMHSRKPPVIHRDLKCDNIFITGTTGSVKIGDLGLAVFKTETFAKSMRGTVEFMAPEMFEELYDEMVDVYSFGLCMLELVTGDYPYMECRFPTAVMKKVISGQRPDCYYKVKNECVREIIDCCIRRDKDQRLSAKQLLKHSFFMENNGLVMEIVHPKERRATLADRIVEFKLKIEDSSKRTHSLGQSDALAFKFDVKLDNHEKICAELLEKKLIFDEDVAFVAQSINDKLRALDYERLDELERENANAANRERLDTANSAKNKVFASVSTSPCNMANDDVSANNQTKNDVLLVNTADSTFVNICDNDADLANDCYQPVGKVQNQKQEQHQSSTVPPDSTNVPLIIATDNNAESTVTPLATVNANLLQSTPCSHLLNQNVINASENNPQPVVNLLPANKTVHQSSNLSDFNVLNCRHQNGAAIPPTLNIQEAALIAANVASNRFTVVPHSMKANELEFTCGKRSDEPQYKMQSISLSQIKRIQITVVSIIKNQVKCIFEIPGVFIEFLFDQARFNPEIVGSVISSMIVKRSTKEEIYQYKIPLTVSCIQCLTNIVKAIKPSNNGGGKCIMSGGNVFVCDVKLNEAEGETTLTADKLANSIKRHSADYKQSFIVSKMNVDKFMIGTSNIGAIDSSCCAPTNPIYMSSKMVDVNPNMAISSPTYAVFAPPVEAVNNSLSRQMYYSDTGHNTSSPTTFSESQGLQSRQTSEDLSDHHVYYLSKFAAAAAKISPSVISATQHQQLVTKLDPSKPHYFTFDNDNASVGYSIAPSPTTAITTTTIITNAASSDGFIITNNPVNPSINKIDDLRYNAVEMDNRFALTDSAVDSSSINIEKGITPSSIDNSDHLDQCEFNEFIDDSHMQHQNSITTPATTWNKDNVVDGDRVEDMHTNIHIQAGTSSHLLCSSFKPDENVISLEDGCHHGPSIRYVEQQQTYPSLISTTNSFDGQESNFSGDTVDIVNKRNSIDTNYSASDHTISNAAIQSLHLFPSTESKSSSRLTAVTSAAISNCSGNKKCIEDDVIYNNQSNKKSLVDTSSTTFQSPKVTVISNERGCNVDNDTAASRTSSFVNKPSELNAEKVIDHSGTVYNAGAMNAVVDKDKIERLPGTAISKDDANFTTQSTVITSIPSEHNEVVGMEYAGFNSNMPINSCPIDNKNDLITLNSYTNASAITSDDLKLVSPSTTSAVIANSCNCPVQSKPSLTFASEVPALSPKPQQQYQQPVSLGFNNPGTPDGHQQQRKKSLEPSSEIGLVSNVEASGNTVILNSANLSSSLNVAGYPVNIFTSNASVAAVNNNISLSTPTTAASICSNTICNIVQGDPDSQKSLKSQDYQQHLQQLDENLKQALGRPKSGQDAVIGCSAGPHRRESSSSTATVLVDSVHTIPLAADIGNITGVDLLLHDVEGHPLSARKESIVGGNSGTNNELLATNSPFQHQNELSKFALSSPPHQVINSANPLLITQPQTHSNNLTGMTKPLVTSKILSSAVSAAQINSNISHPNQHYDDYSSSGHRRLSQQLKLAGSIVPSLSNSNTNSNQPQDGTGCRPQEFPSASATTTVVKAISSALAASTSVNSQPGSFKVKDRFTVIPIKNSTLEIDNIDQIKLISAASSVKSDDVVSNTLTNKSVSISQYANNSDVSVLPGQQFNRNSANLKCSNTSSAGSMNTDVQVSLTKIQPQQTYNSIDSTASQHVPVSALENDVMESPVASLLLDDAVATSSDNRAKQILNSIQQLNESEQLVVLNNLFPKFVIDNPPPTVHSSLVNIVSQQQQQQSCQTVGGLSLTSSLLSAPSSTVVNNNQLYLNDIQFGQQHRNSKSKHLPQNMIHFRPPPPPPPSSHSLIPPHPSLHYNSIQSGSSQCNMSSVAWPSNINTIHHPQRLLNVDGNPSNIALNYSDHSSFIQQNRVHDHRTIMDNNVDPKSYNHNKYLTPIDRSITTAPSQDRYSANHLSSIMTKTNMYPGANSRCVCECNADQRLHVYNNDTSYEAANDALSAKIKSSHGFVDADDYETGKRLVAHRPDKPYSSYANNKAKLSKDDFIKNDDYYYNKINKDINHYLEETYANNVPSQSDCGNPEYRDKIIDHHQQCACCTRNMSQSDCCTYIHAMQRLRDCLLSPSFPLDRDDNYGLGISDKADDERDLDKEAYDQAYKECLDQLIKLHYINIKKFPKYHPSYFTRHVRMLPSSVRYCNNSICNQCCLEEGKTNVKHNNKVSSQTTDLEMNPSSLFDRPRFKGNDELYPNKTNDQHGKPLMNIPINDYINRYSHHICSQKCTFPVNCQNTSGLLNNLTAKLVGDTLNDLFSRQKKELIELVNHHYSDVHQVFETFYRFLDNHVVNYLPEQSSATCNFCKECNQYQHNVANRSTDLNYRPHGQDNDIATFRDDPTEIDDNQHQSLSLCSHHQLQQQHQQRKQYKNKLSDYWPAAKYRYPVNAAGKPPVLPGTASNDNYHNHYYDNHKRPCCNFDTKRPEHTLGTEDNNSNGCMSNLVQQQKAAAYYRQDAKIPCKHLAHQHRISNPPLLSRYTQPDNNFRDNEHYDRKDI